MKSDIMFHPGHGPQHPECRTDHVYTQITRTLKQRTSSRASVLSMTARGGALGGVGAMTRSAQGRSP